MVVTTELHVPNLARVVPDGVFDAWSWCASDVLEWRRPSRELDKRAPIDGRNPAGLVFVFRDGADASFLPRELASLHAPGYGLGDGAWALAPYAIDDATDRLHARRARPRDVFWLGAASLDALVWGLHDWVHFHNHGPFDQPALTELQCDLVALAWLRLNREAVGLTDADLDRVARELAALSRRRFAEEERAGPDDLDALFAGPYPAAPVSLRVSQA